MVIIQLAGGLGNQMFQYALSLQLKSLGRIVKIDDVSGFEQDRQREPALAAFGIEYERASRRELEAMLDSSPLLYHKIHRKLCGRKKKSYFEADKSYKPEILQWDDIYLEGYWQTEKYFQGVSEQVKAVFDTDRLLQSVVENLPDQSGKRSLAEDNIRNEIDMGEREDSRRKGRTLQEWLERINSADSVSVHIRRGDYLLPENQELFGGICTEAYYRAAMERMAKEHPGCIFYFFTNDKQWTRKWIGGESEHSAVDARTEIVDLADIPVCGMEKDYAEFVLMSRCRHNILANSSFSWWASYLNRNPDRTVLAPDRWLNGWDCRDFYREDMQRIERK